MLERLNLALFQFNLWANEYLNLHCAKYELGNSANNVHVDMRHVYAMHLHFLARAPIEEIWQFYIAHKTEHDKKLWAMHMLRVQEALMTCKGKALPDDHEVMCGTEEVPIPRESASDVRNYMQYYVHHKKFVNTQDYMRMMAKVQASMGDPDSERLAKADRACAETWWEKGQVIQAEQVEALLEAVLSKKNAVDSTVNWCGEVISVRTAQDAVNQSAASSAPRTTRSQAAAERIHGAAPNATNNSRKLYFIYINYTFTTDLCAHL